MMINQEHARKERIFQGGKSLRWPDVKEQPNMTCKGNQFDLRKQGIQVL